MNELDVLFESASAVTCGLMETDPPRAFKAACARADVREYLLHARSWLMTPRTAAKFRWALKPYGIAVVSDQGLRPSSTHIGVEVVPV
jgi:hypothetical protein